MHVEKFRRCAVGHMLRHFNRCAINFKNTDIDHTKSDLNYNLAPKRDMLDIEYYKKRLSTVKCQNRSDVKTLCDWIITLPKSISDEQEKRFFQKAYEFMTKRYCEENVISAWVHKDEAGRSHMHFAFIPVCVDKKKGIQKVSAKEVLTRMELKSIHREMAEHMKKEFGFDVGILNGATENGNKTVMELKSEELKEQINTLNKFKNQSIIDMANTIKQKPNLLSNINRAVKIAIGKEKPPQIKEQTRDLERTR